MSNLAEQKVFPIRPDLQVVEQRVADTEDGYTRLANELLEELIGANLTRNQAKVAFAVCRKTYGFNKKTDRISDGQISQITRLPRQKVNKAKNELIAMKVLIKDGAAIGPNKNLSEWRIPECHHDGVSVTKTVTKSVTKTVTALSPKQGHTKDTITKDKKDNKNIPPVVPQPEKSGKPEKPKKRATQYPGDFTPNDGNIRLAGDLGVDLQSEAAAFADYHQSKGSTFTNWNLALNTWLRNAVKFGRKSQPVQRGNRSQPENFATKDYGQTEIPAWAQELT